MGEFVARKPRPEPPIAANPQAKQEREAQSTAWGGDSRMAFSMSSLFEHRKASRGTNLFLKESACSRIALFSTH